MILHQLICRGVANFGTRCRSKITITKSNFFVFPLWVHVTMCPVHSESPASSTKHVLNTYNIYWLFVEFTVLMWSL